MPRYPIVIHKDKNSDYGVTVPDLPGCFSAGKSYEEAIENSIEAIECHLEGLLLDGEPIPQPQSIAEYARNRIYKGGLWFLVPIDLSKLSGSSKRVNITLPEKLLHQMDQYAKKHGQSRSGLIANAAIEYITRSH